MLKLSQSSQLFYFLWERGLLFSVIFFFSKAMFSRIMWLNKLTLSSLKTNKVHWSVLSLLDLQNKKILEKEQYEQKVHPLYTRQRQIKRDFETIFQILKLMIFKPLHDRSCSIIWKVCDLQYQSVRAAAPELIHILVPFRWLVT